MNLLSDYSKTKFHETTKKVPNRCFFFPKNSQFLGSKKALITDTERDKKKTQWNEQLAIDNVINNDNNVVNIDNIGNSMNRHMQQIDHQTGEVVEGFVAYVVPKRKNGFQKGWMAMAQKQ